MQVLNTERMFVHTVLKCYTATAVNIVINYDCVCIIVSAVLMANYPQIGALPFLFVNCMTWVSIDPFGTLLPSHNIILLVH